MHHAKEDLTVVMETPAAVAQQQPGFGAATEYGELAAEHFFATASPVTQIALGTLVLGMLGLLLGSGLIGLQTQRAQQRHAKGNE